MVFEVVIPCNSKNSFFLAVEFPKWSSAKDFIQELSPLQDLILVITFVTILSTFSPISKCSFDVWPLVVVPIKNIHSVG